MNIQDHHEIAERKFQAEMVRAGQQVATTAPQPPADFHSLLIRIQQATMDAREAATHADIIAGTMHGYRAENEVAEGGRDQRSGLIGQYEDAIDELMSALSDTRSSLRRISNGIPDMPKGLLG